MKQKIRFLLKKIAWCRVYFNRGYAVYFAMPMFFLNTALIVYNFLIKKLQFIPPEFNRFYIFALAFLCTFIPLAVLIGYLDYRKGLYKHEDSMARIVSPVTKDMFAYLERIEKKIDEKL